MATIVLVHGICHGAWCWDATVQALSERGHQVVALDLPLTSLADDAAAVRRALDALDGPVVLVGHSYGGLVISSAAAGRDDIAHLVYVAAAMVPGDDVFMERAGAYPPSPLAEQAQFTEDGQIFVSPEAAVDCFYQECDAAAASAAAARLRPTAVACLAAPTGGEPWANVPSTYLLCTLDRAIHPEMQQWMATRATEVVTFETDHSPFLSEPDRFIELLDGIAVG